MLGLQRINKFKLLAIFTVYAVILITCMWTAIVVNMHTFPVLFGCITKMFALDSS